MKWFCGEGVKHPLLYEILRLVSRWSLTRPATFSLGRRAAIRMDLLEMPQLTLDYGVGNEEDRCVVAHHVPVAFFGVKFQGETAHASLCIGGAELAGHRREAGQHFRFFPDRGKDPGFGVFRDSVGDGKRAMNFPALVMDPHARESFRGSGGRAFRSTDSSAPGAGRGVRQ